MNPKPEKTPILDSDYETVKAIQAGEACRFPELVNKYQKPLYNFGLRICRDVRDAEDLVQETFLNAYRFLGGFRFETRFRNWLYRIAGNLCMKQKQGRTCPAESELSLEEFIPDDPANASETIPGWAARPLGRLLNRELKTVVRQAVHELPREYRLVIALRDLEEFSTEETARILDITPANVKVRLHRARLFVRKKLEAYFKDE